ncbi:hypothetical protein GLYMA_07G136100v4 [Glycine max]|nr:hypothetical protein GLYMA_07G136100v4 [Glycine max]
MAETKLSFKDKRWSLHGMTALVTGATRGIGHAIVEELAEFGAAVHICARNQDDIDKCLEEWKGKGLTVTGSVCDLQCSDQRKRLMEILSSIFHGKLNILVNNAATTITKKIIDYTAEDISTIMGLKALPVFSVYAASKGAMNQFTKNLALEWAKDNIRANAVAPGPVMTKLLDSIMNSSGGDESVDGIVSQTLVGRMGEAKEISALVAFLCLPAVGVSQLSLLLFIWLLNKILVFFLYRLSFFRPNHAWYIVGWICQLFLNI